ncbi:MAG: sugar transferase [Acidobacteriota bacterium]|nr:sugar transferase [Acidobacteriota bacterium]
MQVSRSVFEPNSVSVQQLPFSHFVRQGDGSSPRRAHIHRYPASAWSLSWSKRLLDFSVAVLVLAVFAVPMLVIALCVRLSSKGPALFVQNRVGRGTRPFAIYKFRTMEAVPANSSGPGLTRGGDHRITRMGARLRKLKLDELPQFYNILRGDMSLVGPRPKLPQYATAVDALYRPGLTGAATLAFRCEEDILRGVHPAQLETFYNRRIRPLKARMDARYMSRATFRSDLRIIGATFLACATPPRIPVSFRDNRGQTLAFRALADTGSLFEN